MPDVDQVATDTRSALERVIANPKAKPADVVKAAELLRAMGAVDQAASVLDLDDASLLRIARSGVREGGGEQNEGPEAAGQSRVPCDAVSTRHDSMGPKEDPSFYADPPGGCEIDPLS